jgi:aminopeptidase N
MVALSNGVLVSEDVEGERRRFHYRHETPHSCYLITLVAGDFARLEDRWGEVELSTWCPPGREDDARRTLGRTPEMMEVLSGRFGVPYPYPRYAQVFVADFIFGGMENTTATTLTDAAMLDERAAIDVNMERLVAHELAHQWFGDLITCRDWGQGWLNEGFATYAEYLWREAAGGIDEAFMELSGWADAYLEEDRKRYRRTVATNVYELPLDVFDHHLYDKGGRILHMLRAVLGDEGFFATLRHYLEKHRHDSVETRDLARAALDATGRSMDWFFDQWVEKGAGHPELEVEVAWDGERHLAAIRVRQTQKVEGPTPLFRLPLAVHLVAGGESRPVTLEVREADQTFYVALPEAPAQAIVDPGKSTLCTLESKKSPAMWIAELAGAERAADRIDAARALGKIGSREAREALERALTGDGFWGVQSAAATALAEIRSPAARDAIAAALPGLESPKARRGAVRALAQFRGDERAAAAVAGLAAGDPSLLVESEALLALGSIRAPGAAEILGAAMDRDSWSDLIRQHVVRGLAELGDVAATGEILAAAEYGKTSPLRRAAAVAAGKLAAGRRDHHGRRVRERLEELLRDPDFRVQGAAVEALRALGDADATAELQALAERDLDGRLRRRAREVIRDLAEARPRAEAIAALEDQVNRLRDMVGELRGRLDALESS